MGKTSDALREAGFRPLPRLWVTEDQLEQIVRMAKENEEAVTAIRREVSSGARSPNPQAKAAQVARELLSAIDRMWHVANDRALSDDDKLDIIYSELNKNRTQGG